MTFTTRPRIMGRHAVVASGHYLATAAGFRIIENGGNAIDAAAAVCFCLNVLEPHQNGIGGEVPVLVRDADGQVHAISGMGWSPKALTLDWCKANGVDIIPGDGFVPACVPSVIGTWAVALRKFGTKTMGEVLAPAIELAECGFPLYGKLREYLLENADRFVRDYPTTAEIYCPNGAVPNEGTLIKNPDLAKVFRAMCDAERSSASSGRDAAIKAACGAFYKGGIAEEIIKFISTTPVRDETGARRTGLLSRDDLAEWRATIEEPLSLDYRGLTVHKCPTWTQGAVFLQQLALLEGFDLKSMEPLSPDFIHTVVEAAKLAFADREAYYGDPQFDKVPIKVLLSKEYNDMRRGLIDSDASYSLRPGDAGCGDRGFADFDVLGGNRRALGLAGKGHNASCGFCGDTTKLDVVDSSGMMVSATPSGGWIRSSPVIPGLGFSLGTRAQMFYLDAARPNCLAPRKRPRTTLTPTLVTKNGAPFLSFGTPGGDAQDQTSLVFLLNYIEFGMDIQSAIESPNFYSAHWPDSFYPRSAFPGRVVVENRIPDSVLSELSARGHSIQKAGAWSGGNVMAVRWHDDEKVIEGGMAPRRDVGYAFGW